MHDKPLVTVITGYYKRCHLLDRTIRSLLDQNYSNLEIIVFDDASCDGTAEKLLEYARAYPNVRPIIHEKNIGFVSGLIDAISYAKGGYIAIQSSGDVSYPERISSQVELMESDSDLVVVGCYYKNVIEESGLERVRTPNADALDFAKLLNGNVFSHGEVMFRKDAYLKAGGYRKAFKFCQDYDLWLRMIKIGRFATVKRVVFERYIQFDGVSYDPQKSVRQGKYSILAKKLAKGEASVDVLESVLQHGIDNFVSIGDRDLQKRIVKNSLRAAVWGDVRNALDYSEYVHSSVVRALVRTCIKLMSYKALSPFSGLVLFLLKVEQRDNA